MSLFPEGLGVGAPWQTMPDPYPALDMLKPDWWYDWGNKAHPGRWPTGEWEKSYYPMMFRHAVGLSGSKFDASDAGRAWILFNEPCQPGQTNLTSTSAIDEALELYNYGAKRFIAGGIVITEDFPYDERIGWLSGYVRKGGIIPGRWHIHCYGWAYGENPNLAGLQAKVRRFEKWMATLNVVRPIVVSEFSAQSHPPSKQIELLGAARHMLAKGDISAAAWFSTNYFNDGGDLVRDGELTEVGRAFADKSSKHYFPSIFQSLAGKWS